MKPFKTNKHNKTQQTFKQTKKIKPKQKNTKTANLRKQNKNKKQNETKRNETKQKQTKEQIKKCFWSFSEYEWQHNLSK